MPDKAPSSSLLPQLRSMLGRGSLDVSVLDGANRILESALISTSDEELGETCLAVVEELTGSEFGFIGMLGEDGTLYDVAISNPGWDACDIYDKTGHRRPQAQFDIVGLYGHVLDAGESLASNEPSADEHSIGTPKGHPRLKAFLGTPLKIAGETVGLVALANRKGGYRQADVAVVESLAPAIAMALHTKRAASQLATSSQMLAAHMENSPLAIIEFDSSFRVTRWSDEASKMFGWAADEMIGNQIGAVRWVYEEDIAKVASETDGFLGGRVSRNLNVNRNYRKDGSLIWCEWYSSAIYDDTGTLTSVLSQVLDVTARVRAEKAASEELERTQLLLEAAAALASGTSLDDVLGRLCDMVLRAVAHSRVTVTLWDAAASELEATASRGERAVPPGLKIHLDSLATLVRDTVRSAETRVIDFDSASANARAFGDMVASHLALIVPLVYGDKFVGLLIIDDPGGRLGFDDREIEIAEGLASQAAVAIENARIAQRDREQARLTGRLTEIEERLHSSLDADSLIQQALADGVEVLGADTGAVTQLERGGFLVTFSVGFDVAGTLLSREVEPHSVLAIESQRPVVIEDARTDERVRPEHLAKYGVAAVIVVPLIVGGEAQGNLYFNFAKPRLFSDAEIRFAQRLGSSLSLAIENARLFDVERTNARINEALARIDQSIHATFDREEILQRVAVESAEAIGADSTVLCTLDGDDWVVRYAYNMPQEVIGQEFTVEQAPFMGIAAETERPVALDDAFNDSRAKLETQQLLGVRAVMMTALIVRDEVVGGLFFNYWDVHHFTQPEIAYASQLAASVALAMDNGRLYEAERTIADRLQEALLTLPERLPGLEFAHAYRSAAESGRVGGDFYDIFDLEHDRIGITIGDVAGHGLDAAVLTSLAKNTIRAHATEGGKTPGQILTLTNEVVFKATPAESFVTVFFGILDCEDGRLTYSNAGHPPGLLVRRDEGISRLTATGPLLGAFSNVAFEQSEACLVIGDLMLLYTDGLTEAWRDGEFYRESRLLTFLSSMSGDSAGAIVDAVIADVVAFTGDRLRDDLAVLTLRRVERGIEAPVQQRLGI